MISMELIRGDNFAIRPHSTEGILRDLFGQLAAGLNALHEAGILHCDLKPANVLIEYGGRVVILDFGLAHRILNSGGSATVLACTPDYAAPDQLSNCEIGEAADWYSLGVMLYEAMTGQLPYLRIEVHLPRF